MSENFRSSIGDFRFQDEDLSNLYKSSFSASLNILDVFPSSPLFESFLYVGAKAGLDLAHLKLLRDYPGVNVKTIEDCGHDLVHDLRETGQLDDLLKMHFNLPY